MLVVGSLLSASSTRYGTQEQQQPSVSQPPCNPELQTREVGKGERYREVRKQGAEVQMKSQQSESKQTGGILGGCSAGSPSPEEAGAAALRWLPGGAQAR
mmetsp:Transcript_7163/g.15547  ORF Transcript_7163/g.15547 Transcript_7163/m.15547 type:complete len:100 (-) Transcript_7163:110-409(-)